MAITITVNISRAEEACLRNDLMDIEDWVQKAVRGKINQCRKRFIREWQPKLMADPNVTDMPADEQRFIDAVLSRDDYMNRVDREAAAIAQAEADAIARTEEIIE